MKGIENMKKQYLIKVTFFDRKTGQTNTRVFYKNVKPESIERHFYEVVGTYLNMKDVQDVNAYCEEIIETKATELKF